jgi:signal transduction histidine kinase/PAS domain-containing protein
MTENKPGGILRSIFIGERFHELDFINQVRYIAITGLFALLVIPLIIVGSTYIGVHTYRLFIKSFMVFSCIAAVVLLRFRTKIPLHLIPIIPVSISAVYWLYLFYTGEFHFWIAIWILAFPPVAILLCGMLVGLIQSAIVFFTVLLFIFTPLAPVSPDFQIYLRFILFYLFILGIVIIDERIQGFTVKREADSAIKLAQEKDIIKTMKDNLPQGIFLMNNEYKILPLYSEPLITIFSYYDSELEGKNFLDILSASLSAKQLQIMQSYFSMIFSKSKSTRVLESANPISEFEYRIDDRIKILSTKFGLIEQSGSEPVIIGIIQDITKEKEFEKDILEQKAAQEQEMQSMFEVIQVDPMVFQDFIDDTEANFNYINSLLKNKTLSEKQVVTKFFQNIHAIKANALILGLENFGKKLHDFEEEIGKVMAFDEIAIQDVFLLAVKLEAIMQEKDSYTKMVKKIESFKSAHKIDSVLVHSLEMAVQTISEETQKKVELRVGQVDKEILETSLRKPLKDILFQCVRNAIYHGIETTDERLQKNKKPQGLLAVDLKKVDNRAELTISDDGRGLDWEKIKKKYLEMNPEAKEPNKNALLASIFAPEFSTAEEVTSVAGRGVGLNLVKTLVKENNGTISVNSSETGLTFKFTFLLSA